MSQPGLQVVVVFRAEDPPCIRPVALALPRFAAGRVARPAQGDTVVG